MSPAVLNRPDELHAHGVAGVSASEGSVVKCRVAMWRGSVAQGRVLGYAGWRARRVEVAVLATLAVLCLCTAAVAAAVRTKAHTASAKLVKNTLIVPSGNAASPFGVAHELALPAGWRAEVWARVSGPRFEVWTPQGRLLVSASGSGEVVELTPGVAGGAASRRTLLSGLTAPQGLAFDKIGTVEYLYVAESNQIDRYVWSSNGSPGARTVLIKGLPDTSSTGDDVHRPKSIAIGQDHKIYVAIGSASNATPDEPGESPPRASVLSFSPEGTEMRVFATGVRNGEGLSFAPDGTLWTAVNERDEVPYPFHRAYGEFSEAYGHVIPQYVDEHPPDEVARLTAGRNLGWPYCNPDPDKKPGNPKTGMNYLRLPFDRDESTNPAGAALDCSTLAPIDVGLPAHSAPLGFTFLEGSTIKGHFSHGAALAVHGSWDRSPPRPPAVLWLPWQKRGSTLGKATTIVEGFQESSGSRWGRPVDAVPGPDGSLYVTDDTAGAVYRLGPSVGQ
jgi:glucose/arabinose dehydrogenase